MAKQTSRTGSFPRADLDFPDARARFDAARLPLLLIAMLALSLGAMGCGDVKKCKKGTDGCLEGKPFPSGTEKGRCGYGLVVKNGVCVEPEGGETGGRDGGTDAGGSDGSTPNGDCTCASDEVCSPESETTYLRYCDPQPTLTAVTPPPACSDYSGAMVKPLTFAAACKNTCLQFCKRAETFCPGFVCDPTSCDSLEQTALCATECGTDATCMADRCEGIRDASCTDFLCPDGFAKSCADVRCTDTCSGDNNGDGFCDDGEPLSASYAYCAYGTDCGDCGPRKGAKAALAALGGQCVRDVGCPGFDPDFLKTDSWCLNVPGTAATQFACIPNCTGHEDEDGFCPDGYECQGIEYSDGTPFTNSSRLQGFGCVPQVCQ